MTPIKRRKRQKLKASVEQPVKCAFVKTEKNEFKSFQDEFVSCLILS